MRTFTKLLLAAIALAWTQTQLDAQTRDGVDYSYSRPDPNALRQAGKDFVIRYVGGSGSSVGKNITASEVQSLRAASLDIVIVFESYAQRMLEGYSAGAADANTAIAQATQAGAPSNFFCYFACDFDATLANQTAINAYLDGAASVIGLQRVGIYAGYWPLSRALNANKATKGWQTAAWSGGNLDTRAVLYQFDFSVIIGGGECDLDNGYGNDLGQWVFSSNPPTVQTLAASSVTSTSAVINGTVTNNGGAPVDNYYFYYWINPNGVPIGVDSSAITVSGNNFSAHIQGLTSGVAYSYRAYAHNSSTGNVGWGPGWGRDWLLHFQLGQLGRTPQKPTSTAMAPRT